MRHSSSPLTLILSALLCPWVIASDQADEQHFVSKVLPVFKEKCLACHGDDPKKIKGDFDMRTLESFQKGGESEHPPVIAGKPESSPLFIAVSRTDDDLAMPPKENDKLTREQVEDIKQWIVKGAVWPSEERRVELQKWASKNNSAEGSTVHTSGGLSADWTNRLYKIENLWAYQPLSNAKPPEGKGPHPIDAFLNDRIGTLKVTVAPRCDRRTLIRRASYDLTGLPPAPDEIEAFIHDPLPQDKAFEKVIDRLLSSPQYGEQWGRHWLDVVRYADSSGFANDYERGSTWRYRDYVIRSFNADKPYDQFIKEQIAGDEMPDDAKRASSEKLIATGFLRMGPWELTSMEVAKVARQRFLDDVTDVVSQTFLSHTLQCARCHDHKFDPIPTRDYYSMMACFSTTQLVEHEAAFLPEENVQGFEEKKHLESRRDGYQKVLDELAKKEEAAAQIWCQENGKTYISRNKGLKQGIPESDLPPRNIGFSTVDIGMERIARKGLERLKWEMDRYEPVAFSVYSGRTPELTAVYQPLRMPGNPMKNGELEEPCILIGGDPFSPKDKVTPGVLSALEGMGNKIHSSLPTEITGRRKGLAEWIASPKNPLTSRSIVNRIWQWHFGQPIAGNPNNFGATGKKPTHPELLDWLAGQFVEGGWSIKAMHRLIMTSDAYQRSTDHPDRKLLAKNDPEGISYAVFKPRRLTAEELRDSMLFATGELNPVMGGIPVRPEINLEAALQPRQVMGTFATAWQPSPKPEQRHRRSIYALKIRGLHDPQMEVFNEPSPEFSCEARDASNVTPQVFSLFNSEASNDRALALANRILNKEKLTGELAVERAFTLVIGHKPSKEQTASCLAHWDEMTQRHEKLTFPKPLYPREVVREAVEENTGEKFTFLEKLEVYEEFIPDLKPSDVNAQTRALAEVCLVLLNSNEFVYLY